ncbi:MAG: fatty-acid desaturase [Bacteroidia bacterium]|jgi:stearoyl-CoA desaturase (delta-9 desaturase)
MAYIDQILEPPAYGWSDKNGDLIVPTYKQVFKEFFSRMNIFQSRKNWLSLSSYVWAFALLPFMIIFITNYFSWWLLPVGFLYSMVGMGSHGTVWFHRYATHRAFKFKNAFWRTITQNLVIKALPDEVYIISHHVHHALSDKPGDPYNAQGGFLSCFLADAVHNLIARDMDEKRYNRVASLMKDTGTKINTYEQYLKWGSVSHPLWTWVQLILNWAFWYGAFYFIGGHALACCMFGWAHVWALGVRTFNYEGHGKGEDLRQEGFDFNTLDFSINQYWPGYVAGEWHSNHHMFPGSARNGFTPLQLDLPWYYIKFLHAIGGISHYRDSKQVFLEKYYIPYKKAKKAKKLEGKRAAVA